MDRAITLFAACLGAALAGCGEPAPRGGPAERASQAGPETRASTDPEPMADFHLGPLRIEYDSTRLTLAELAIDLPPGYEDEAAVVKLIPVERASVLGQETCRYGQSGNAQPCNAEDEAGLVLALLERPLADYRQAFAAQDLEDALGPARIDGAQGFSFTAQAEGSGIEYRFVPVQERTLLVARQFAGEQEGGAEAMRQVIASVARAVADSNG